MVFSDIEDMIDDLNFELEINWIYIEWFMSIVK
jgi:hypothetical protein